MESLFASAEPLYSFNIGAPLDNFTYNYTANTNKLTSVANAVGPSTYGSYAYDEIGRLKSQANTVGTTYLKYDVTGKITGIYADAAFTALKIGYTYDESGNRIASINNTGSQPITTYYVYDATGNVLAVYTQSGAGTPAIAEVPVYGNDRLGTYFTAGNNYIYEIRDNVGSVRVTLSGTKVNGLASVYNFGDYYPFGGIAQNSAGYRYGYQGAYSEKDAVTGYNNFELRMYDGRIGRWLGIDPMGQFNSSYEGMGNNPISGFDPTGGFDWYHNDDTGSYFWKDGSAQTVTGDDGLQYNNVGAMVDWAQNIIAEDGTKIYEFWHGGPDGQRIMTGYDEKQGVPDGMVNSISAGFALGGGFGFELGHVTDWTGKDKWFWSASANIGLGAGIGLNHREIKSNRGQQFKVNDYKGTSSSINANAGPFGYSHSGDNIQGWKEKSWGIKGDTYSEQGGGLDPTSPKALLQAPDKVGIMWSHTSTNFFK